METAASAQDTLSTRDYPAVENADQHSSSDEYARRFGGDVGNWMLAVQEDALSSMLGPGVTTVLDVGGGHGQLAMPLITRQKSVTILGSSHVCAARIQPLIDAGSVTFKVGNLIQLPFESKSFDSVVSFRIMSHCTAWRTLIAEMCRVSSGSVVFDYPAWCSVNFLTPLLFSIKKKIEGNTRTYRIFTTRELVDEFRRNGFQPAALRKQFFFPMGIHRAINNVVISKVLEGAAKVLGLTRLFGSPIVISFKRITSDAA